VTFEVILEEVALNQAAGFLPDDPEGLKQVLAAIDALPQEPRPATSFPFGSADFRRLRVGRYRVMYKIIDQSISVTHIGRTAARPPHSPR
jgi:mRNA interferase RelE/StbE